MSHTCTAVPLVARVWVCGPGWCQSPGPQSRHCRSLVAVPGDTCGRHAARGAQQLLASSPPAPVKREAITKVNSGSHHSKNHKLQFLAADWKSYSENGPIKSPSLIAGCPQTIDSRFRIKLNDSEIIIIYTRSVRYRHALQKHCWYTNCG